MSDAKGKTETEKPKVGVYICHCGGNISDHVDVQKVRENAEKMDGVAVAHTNMFMCSDPGQELIQEDIKNGKVNRIVVASCAPSLHEMTFRGAIKRAGHNPYLYEHANIREQVSWVHDGKPATEKATALVAAAVAKSKKLAPLEPIRVDARGHVTVIGAGIAGMRAALDIARRGMKVALVERSPFLGGRIACLDRLVPTGENAGQLLKQIAADVISNQNITVYTCSEIVGYQGFVGNFDLTLKRRPEVSKEDMEKIEKQKAQGAKTGDFVFGAGIYAGDVPNAEETITIETGAIVMATGFENYRPAEGEYGYLKYEQVITLPELIRLLAKNQDHGRMLVINGRKIRRAAFIHCVGSRQIPGIHESNPDGSLNEYCSRTCCAAIMQAAVLIRENFPETRVLDFYRDIRTYGRGQEAVYEKASKLGTTFLRFNPEDPPVIKKGNGDFPLQVNVKDTLTFGEDLDVFVDLVVLATGMIPTPIRELVEMMKLPVGADRFLQEVHPKLRPVELANTGILLAGTCQAPMDVGEACNGAQAAAAKAASLLAKGYVELDPYVAEVDKTRCTGTGACKEACPIDGAINIVEHEVDGNKVKQAEVTPALCTGCGICVAACPANAINIKGWTLEQYEAMVDAVVAA